MGEKPTAADETAREASAPSISERTTASSGVATAREAGSGMATGRLAHEAAHTVQQREGTAADGRSDIAIGDPGTNDNLAIADDDGDGVAVEDARQKQWLNADFKRADAGGGGSGSGGIAIGDPGTNDNLAITDDDGDGVAGADARQKLWHAANFREGAGGGGGGGAGGIAAGDVNADGPIEARTATVDASGPALGRAVGPQGQPDPTPAEGTTKSSKSNSSE